MTFREFMKENGNEVKTTFWEDFSIAERFGLSAIQDTFNSAFKEWKRIPRKKTGVRGTLQYPLGIDRPICDGESER